MFVTYFSATMQTSQRRISIPTLDRPPHSLPLSCYVNSTRVFNEAVRVRVLVARVRRGNFVRLSAHVFSADSDFPLVLTPDGLSVSNLRPRHVRRRLLSLSSPPRRIRPWPQSRSHVVRLEAKQQIRDEEGVTKRAQKVEAEEEKYAKQARRERRRVKDGNEGSEGPAQLRHRLGWGKG